MKVGQALLRLAESKSSKNRVESTCIVRYLLDIYGEGRQRTSSEDAGINQLDLLLARCLLPVLRAHLVQFKEAKVQLNCLIMVSKVFEQLLPADKHFLKSYRSVQASSISEPDLESLDLSKVLPMRLNDPGFLNLRVREMIKLWTPLISYLSSPWGSVRETCCQLLEGFVAVDMWRYKSCYAQKMNELVQPILANLLSSTEHCDRIYGLRIYASAVGMAAQY